jgi:hypoxanthine phosphoribosyltransferase
MDLLRISWEATIEYCEQLALKIKDYRPEVIVGLSRGGLVPTRILSDALGINKVGVLGISHYTGLGKRSEIPVITQDLCMDLKGKRILLVDDVADTGKSLMTAKGYLERMGAREIRIATLHYKPNMAFRPDYFVMTTTSWVAYPWETHETERELSKRKG